MSLSLYNLFGILLFVAVVLFIEGVYTWWNDSRGPEAKRIEARLRVMSAGVHDEDQHLSIVKERLLAEAPAVQRALMHVPRVHALDRLLEQSGRPLSVAQFLSMTLALAAVGAIAAIVLRWPGPIVILVAILCAVLPLLYVLKGKHDRLMKIDEQLPDALDLLARALRSGHALPGALQMASDELPQPTAGEFGITFDEVNYGIAMKEALVNLATRVPIKDLRYFVTAVLIQRETGGNLAELLDNIAAMIRARHKLKGQIRVLSTEGRLSATILTVLPFVVGFVIYGANPRFLELLWTDPAGVKMLVAGAIAMVVGIIWSYKIVKIHV
jgi:tight adherence protein B